MKTNSHPRRMSLDNMQGRKFGPEQFTFAGHGKYFCLSAFIQFTFVDGIILLAFGGTPLKESGVP
jgi:hypothetical protein